MGIFSFESAQEKALKKPKTEYEKSLEKAVKQAELDDKKLEDFFKGEGAKIFLKYIQDERDICLQELKRRPTTEISMRLQERYILRCQDIDMVEMYISRVKPT